MSKELKIFSEKAVALAMVLSYVHGSCATTKTDVDKNKVIST